MSQKKKHGLGDVFIWLIILGVIISAFKSYPILTTILLMLLIGIIIKIKRKIKLKKAAALIQYKKMPKDVKAVVDIGIYKGTWRKSCLCPIAQHAALDGKHFDLRKGMLFESEYIYPGKPRRCKCYWQAD